MDDITLFIGSLFVLAYFIVIPIAMIVVFLRSKQLRKKNEQLEQTMAQLQVSLLRLTAQINSPSLSSHTTSSSRTTSSSHTVSQAEPTVTASAAVEPIPAWGTDVPVESASQLRSGRGDNVTPSLERAHSVTESEWYSRRADTRAERFDVRDEDDTPTEKHAGILSSLIGWLLRGNPLAKVGVLLLFFGLAYLMKYTIERDMLAIQWRLGIAALISSGLLAFGWRLRHQQRLYALILQGGAVGALYITIFGAFRLYLLLPYVGAFALLLLVCIASVGLAILQRSLSLAMLASIGGYLAPLLLSQGGGSHVVLFSYYLLLSLGILAISARQSWRELNLLGLIFTFGVAASWGAAYYQHDFYLSSQLFLIANILLFGVGALLFSLRHQPTSKPVVDGVLLFVPPLIGFGMQYLITEHWQYGPAVSALAYGLGYLLLGGLTRQSSPRLGLFALSLGGCFLTLSVPLALSAQSTAMVWMVEGVCLLWSGLHQKQRRMGWSGSVVLLLGALSVAYAFVVGELSSASFAFIFFTGGMLTMTSLCAAWCWSHYRQVETQWRKFALVFYLLGMVSWLIWILYIAGRVIREYTSVFWLGSEFIPLWRAQDLLQPPLFLVLMAISCLLWQKVGKSLKWPMLRYSSGLLWLFMLYVVIQLVDFSGYSQLRLLSVGEQIAVFLGWIVSFSIAYGLLYRESENIPRRLAQAFHLSLFWMALAFFFLMAEQYWYPLIPAYIDEGAPVLSCILLATIILALVLPVRHRLWPLTHWAQLYNRTGLVPLVATLFTLLASANLLDGQIRWGSQTWPYVPLLNPLEGSMAFGVAALALWYRRALSDSPPSHTLKRSCRLGLWALVIWLLNGLLMRALAWYTETPWDAVALWRSHLIQATFALLWTFSALVCMVWSTRHQQRSGWMMGALLLSLTILKLFLVDSANSGGLARAVAFIGVAILILIVGYFAPLPPKKSINPSETTVIQ